MDAFDLLVAQAYNFVVFAKISNFLTPGPLSETILEELLI